MTRRAGGRRSEPTTFEVYEVVEGGAVDGYRELTLRTTRGDVVSRYYAVPGATRAAIWVGGVGGGWDTPARDLYPRLCRSMVGDGVASLRVRFRHPGDLVESVFDVLTGIAFLTGEGINAIALTGHSFGGAVVIQAAAAAASVKAAVCLATQSYGAAAAAQLGPRCAVVLVHGTNDEVLPPSCSVQVHEWASGPKRLVFLPGAGHGLDEAADEVAGLVRFWIATRLGARSPAG